jgi:cytochrome c peroxidase
VAGINDDVAAGGLVAGGIPLLQGTYGTCHDTPNLGNHSFPTPLNIGTGDPSPDHPSVNLGGLDLSYLPEITVCKKDLTGGLTNDCKTTTDLGQALIDGQFRPHRQDQRTDPARAGSASALFPQWLSGHLVKRREFLRDAL